MKNLYKIKDFARILEVTPATLRNKHRSGEFMPSFVDPNSSHRFYTDELAYRFNSNKKVLIYVNKNDKHNIKMFHEKLISLNIDFKILEKDNGITDYTSNKALRDLLLDISNKDTYTVVYDSSNILNDDLKIINFYIESCRPNIQLKDYRDFSFEANR